MGGEIIIRFYYIIKKAGSVFSEEQSSSQSIAKGGLSMTRCSSDSYIPHFKIATERQLFKAVTVTGV